MMAKDLTTYPENFYRAIFASAPAALFILEPENKKIVETNDAMSALTGFSSEDLVGKTVTETSIFSDAKTLESVISGININKNFERRDLEIIAASGKSLLVSFSACRFEIEDSSFIQCSLMDISKRRERTRESHERALLLAKIAGKAARLGGWSIDLPERTLHWSDENCEIHEVEHGYEPTLDEGISLYPEEFQDIVKRHVELCASQGISYDFELPKYTKKGRLIWVRSIGEAVRDKDGKIVGLQGAFQDITHRREVEAEREKLVKDLQEALAQVNTLEQFLPLCSYCRKVRDDKNYWSQIENYIIEHTETKFSHGICPECYEANLAPEIKALKKNPKRR